jgi:hypothetical protein
MALKNVQRTPGNLALAENTAHSVGFVTIIVTLTITVARSSIVMEGKTSLNRDLNRATAGPTNDDDNNINSIQFNSLLFMCRVNSYKANYRHSTIIIIIIIIIIIMTVWFEL